MRHIDRITFVYGVNSYFYVSYKYYLHTKFYGRYVVEAIYKWS
jgi:hypothetical protein